MSATTEDPEALRFDSHGGGSRNAPFRVYRQTPARRAAASDAVPFVRLHHLAKPIGRISSNDYDLSRFVDLYAGNVHTGRTDGFDRSGHVLLPECGRCASHIARYSTSRSSAHASGPEPESPPLRRTQRRLSRGLSNIRQMSPLPD